MKQGLVQGRRAPDARAVTRSTALATTEIGRWLLGWLGIAALCLVARAAEPPTYQLIDLGTLGGPTSFALDVNNRGQVTGNPRDTTNSTRLHAFHWSNGVMTDLGYLTTGVEFSRGYAINDAGAIVGESDNDISKAFLWSNGVMTNIGTLGGQSAVAHDINEAGEIVGASSNGSASRPYKRLANGTFVDLGTLLGTTNSTGRAWGINDSGVAVGLSRNEANTLSQAAIWTGGSISNLGSLFGGTNFSQAFAVNNSLQVVGESVNGKVSTNSSTDLHRAFVWSNGVMSELPMPTNNAAFVHSEAKDINDAGDIVGNVAQSFGSPTFGGAAVLWRGGEAFDLNTLIAPGSGWVLQTAEGINERGEIVGHGSFEGNTRAFLLRPSVRLTNGHTDLAFTFTNGTFAATVHRDDIDYAPDEAVLVALPGTFVTIPDYAPYRFLGVPGTGIWFLPETQDDNSLFLGLRTEGVHGTGFSNDIVRVNLVNVDGPGHFTLFNSDPIGTPLIYFNTGDGITSADFAEFQGSTHAHYNWTFSQPGDYVITLQASGTLSNGTVVTSRPIDFAFTVEATNVNPAVLTTQHVDIGFALEDGEWDLHVHNESDDIEYAPDGAVLVVGPASYTTVPVDHRYNFLGLQCSGLWILPQVQNTNLLFLGFGAEEIEAGVLQGDQFRVELKSVNGPGDFIVFDIDPFGTPIPLMNSRDDINANDFKNVLAGGHNDLTWAFTASGSYRISFQASGTLSNGTSIASGPVEYLFYVESTNTPPVILTNQHVDIGFAFEDGEWEPHIHNETGDAEYAPDEAVLMVRAQSLARVPDDPRFAFLGASNTPYWVLGNTQNTNLLFLGFGAEEIEAGVFVNNQFRVNLLAVDGPGDFFVYDFDAFGAPIVKMNSADGIDTNDFRMLIAGAHNDMNWAFTAPGTYHVTFEAVGTLTNGTIVSSGPVEYTFCVEAAPISTSEPSLRHYTASTVDAPGASHTVIHAINNDGVIVGEWFNADYTINKGVIRAVDGTMTIVDPAETYSGITMVGVNNMGDVIGVMETDGCLRRGTNFTILSPPGSGSTFPRGLNDSGVVVGDAFGASGTFNWIYDGTNFSTVDIPDAVHSGFLDINNAGDIVGYALRNVITNGVTNAVRFEFVMRGTNYTEVKYPNSTLSALSAISDNGMMLGLFRQAATGTTNRYFLFENATYTELHFSGIPGATRYVPSGLNSYGEIVGHYRTADGAYHGFRARAATMPGTKKLLVANQFGGAIQQYSADGISQGDFARESLEWPGAALQLANGDILISNYGDSSIRRYSRDGRALGVFATAGLDNPIGMTLDATGNVYVANYSGQNILKFAPDGTSLGAFNTILDGPTSIARDRAGHFYVANSVGHYISKFAPNGTLLTNLGQGILHTPVGVVVDALGNLLVSNSRTNNSGLFTIRRFAPDGTDLGDFITNHIASPSGLAIGPANDLFAASIRTGSVMRFDPYGQFIGEIAPGLDFPYLLAFADVPALLRTEHVDVGLEYQNGTWNLNLRDEDNAITYAANEALLRAGAAARGLTPTNTPYHFVGPAGTVVWTLPQFQDERLPFLGAGAETIPDGLFNGNQVQLALDSFRGPGHVAIYSILGLGNPILHINTTDGLSPASDRLNIQAGSHSHFNWAFSAPGVYTLRFVARATVASNSTEVASAPTEFTFFIIEGQPVAPVLSAPRRAGANVLFDLSAELSRAFVIQSSTTLTNWLPVLTNTPASFPSTITLPVNPSEPGRFFRAVTP